MERSKTTKFTINSYNLDRSMDLDQLKKEVEMEKQKDLLNDSEKDLLIDYWLLWSNYGSLILDWIQVKRMVDAYQVNLEKEKDRIEMFEGIRDKIINFGDVSRSWHRDEPTTFYAVVISEWPKALIWGESVEFPKVISSALLTVETLTNDRSDYVRKSLETLKETEKIWSQKILPKIKGAFLTKE